MTNRALLIVGMHRSGTSLTAEFLHRNGLSLGEDFVGTAGELFEDRDFVDLHEQILRRHGISYGGFADLEKLALDDRDLELLRALVAAKSDEQWGFKDPRTCLFLPAYEQLVPDGIYIFLFRGWRQVVQSLLTRQRSRLKRNVQSARSQPRQFPVAARRIAGVVKHRRILTRFDRQIARHGDAWLSAWMAYNRRILSAAADLPRERHIVISSDRLPQCADEMLEWLRASGFRLANVRFDEVYDATKYTRRPDVPSGLSRALVASADSLHAELVATESAWWARD